MHQKTANMCKSMTLRECIGDRLILTARVEKSAMLTALAAKITELEQKNKQELAKQNPDMALVERRNVTIGNIRNTLAVEAERNQMLSPMAAAVARRNQR